MHGTAKQLHRVDGAASQHSEDLAFGSNEADLVAELLAAQAREDFWKYRQFINDGFKRGWWAETISYELQAFWNAYVAGKRPKLLLFSPPQHGKTKAVTDFISWVSGKDKNLRSMFGSYSDTLGTKVNGDLQRIMLSQKYRLVFPETQIADVGNLVVDGIRYQRNTELIEFIKASGSFRNTTVDGQINGMGLDLGVVDDPIKGRAEANSKPVRDKTWNWLVDDFFGRFSDAAALLMMLTRWHKDDPAGRFIEKFPNVRIVSFPAIAIEDEQFRKRGEALFPEHKSLDFLLERKALMSQSSWESQYQQTPITVGGGIFPIEKFSVINAIDKKQIKRMVRYWDKAGTQAGGAYTCGVLMLQMKDDTYVVAHVARGQWSALDRERRIKQQAEIDRDSYGKVAIWVEQEPGSGGKESAENTIRQLAGFKVQKDVVSGQGSKETRADPYSAQVQGGNVSLLSGEWNQAYIDEHETFPNGKFKDQVDASSGAFNKIVLTKGSYDSTMSWV